MHRRTGAGTRAWDWIDTHATGIVVAVAGGVIGIGVILSVALGSRLRFLDETLYLRYADNLVHRHAFTLDGAHPSAYRPPAYPFFLAGLRWCGAGVVGLRIAGAVLLAAAAVGVYVLGRRLYSPAAGAVAAAVTGFYPLLDYTAVTLYPQALVTALMVGGLVAALAALDAPAPRRWALAGCAGLAFGGSVLAAPLYAPACGVLLGWLVLRERHRGGALVAAAILAGAALLPAAWAARNTARFGEFVPVSTNEGINLLIGNNPNARWSTSGGQVDLSRYDQDAVDGSTGATEVEENDRYERAALHWIGAHPRQAAWLYLGKIVNYFNVHNDYATKVSRKEALARDAVSAVSYLPLMLAFLTRIGLGLTGRVPFRRGDGLLAAIVLVSPLAIAVYSTRVRYRFPLDPLMILVVAGMLAAAARRSSPAAALPAQRDAAAS